MFLLKNISVYLCILVLIVGFAPCSNAVKCFLCYGSEDMPCTKDIDPDNVDLEDGIMHIVDCDSECYSWSFFPHHGAEYRYHQRGCNYGNVCVDYMEGSWGNFSPICYTCIGDLCNQKVNTYL